MNAPIGGDTREAKGDAMRQHTPGPWTWAAEHLNSITIRADGVELATVYHDDIDHVTPRQRADATLIAFAPDLYDLAYWIVSGDARRSYRERVESVQRRAKEILKRMKTATPERSEATR